MPSLFKSTDPKQWEDVLSTYWDVVKGVGKEKLEGLERWYQEELPAQLNSQDRLAKEDLIKLVDWKLTRGKWRPRLLTFAQQADEGAVADASLRSFAILTASKGKACSAALLKEAMAPLIELKGVGPATATAIVSLKDASVPFMSDEALIAALGYKDYTMKEAVKLTEALQKKAVELNKAPGAKGSQTEWTARLVEKALFAEAAAAKQSAKGSGSGTKRKR